MTTIPMPPRHLLLRLALPAALVAAALSLLAWSSWRALVPAVTVSVHPVMVRDAGIAGDAGGAQGPAREGAPVQAPGWVEAAPYAIQVRALTPGIVRRVLVLEGQSVAAGEPVAELHDEEQRLALALAEARLSEAVARRDEMRDELRRKEPLVDRGAASAGEVARLRLRVDAMAASIAAGEAERDMTALALERTTVRAPAAGTVMVRNAVPGMPVGMADGEALVELYDPRALQVRADVPLADAGRVSVGDRAELRVDAFPGRAMRGEVTRFVHRADVAKNTVEVKVRVDDPADGLKPDMLARVRIFPRAADGAPASGPDAGRAARTATWIRQECVLRDGATASVRVVAGLSGDRGTVERRPVVVAGEPIDGWVRVERGVRAGDLLIEGDAAMPDGTAVRVDPSRVHGAAGADPGTNQATAKGGNDVRD